MRQHQTDAPQGCVPHCCVRLNVAGALGRFAYPPAKPGRNVARDCPAARGWGRNSLPRRPRAFQNSAEGFWNVIARSSGVGWATFR